MARVVIPGGSGYLGRALAERLVARGDDVVVLTRGKGRQAGGLREVSWDARSVGDWVEELDGAAAIVHLTGRRVDTRSTLTVVDEFASFVRPVGFPRLSSFCTKLTSISQDQVDAADTFPTVLARFRA